MVALLLINMRKINKKIIIIILVLIILIGTIFFIKRKEINNQKEENNIHESNSVNNEILEENTSKEPNSIKEEILKEENITEEQKEEIEEAKKDTGKTGETNLYEIQEGYGNVKIATIKPSIKYKVAFAGMIKKSLPSMKELDSIIENNHPEYAGIYVDKSDKKAFLKYLENTTLSKYSIDNNGYLRITNKDKQNENDKKIEKAINGEKLYIISISSVCYIVDEITGEILDYSFEELDKYQTYEYFEDENKMLIFITENKNKQLSSSEIINSVIGLISQ